MSRNKQNTRKGVTKKSQNRKALRLLPKSNREERLLPINSRAKALLAVPGLEKNSFRRELKKWKQELHVNGEEKKKEAQKVNEVVKEDTARKTEKGKERPTCNAFSAIVSSLKKTNEEEKNKK